MDSAFSSAAPRRVYWAGDLFDFKDLVGNRLLADAFNRKAQGHWIAVLPQENESNAERADSIRDDDLEQVFSSDAVVANFDGTDLDSGTVVEFCFAKFLDLPTLLLRTDFRNSNDPATCADPWNLMCSGFPRTETLLFNVMQQIREKSFPEIAGELAEKILASLERCDAMPRISPDRETAFAAFQRAVQAAGGSMPQRFPEERIRTILAARY